MGTDWYEQIEYKEIAIYNKIKYIKKLRNCSPRTLLNLLIEFKKSGLENIIAIVLFALYLEFFESWVHMLHIY